MTEKGKIIIEHLPPDLRAHYERVMGWESPHHKGNSDANKRKFFENIKAFFGTRARKKTRAGKIFRLISIVSLIFLIIAGPLIYLFLHSPKGAQAAWFDPAWAYRQSIYITNNGSAQTNYVVPVVIDTATLIATGKMQSNCADLRFTNSGVAALGFFLEGVCNSAKTVAFVKVDTIAASGVTQIFAYYGNISAASTSSFDSLPVTVYYGNGADGAIQVSSTDKNINTSTLISGRSCADGGDGVNYSVTANTAASQNQIVLSSTPSSGCLAVGDEVLIINLQGTTGDNSNVGKFETARITSISVATLTLNHNLINGYDGTTQKIMVQRIPNYTNVTVDSTINFTAAAWNGTKGGVMAFRADGTVTVTGNIVGNALGYRGGAGGVSNAGGTNGESYDGSVGSGGASATTGTSGGGAGQHSNTTSTGTRGGGGGGGEGGLSGQVDNDGSGGGGGGAYGGGGGGGAGGGSTTTGGNGGAGASTGVNAGGGGAGGGTSSLAGGNGGAGNTAGSNASGTGGAAGSGATTGGGGGGGLTGSADSGGGGGGGGYFGTTALTTLFLGSGGGGAGGNNTAGTTGATGSTAGGIIFVNASTLTITGSVAANGTNATAAAASVGGGGAGSGGSIKLQSSTTTLGTSLVAATGGSAVNGANRGGGAGGGGTGRIAVNSSTSSGSSNPSATASTVPVAATASTEESRQSVVPPVAYWKFDEGYGTTANDSTTNQNSGTLSGTTKPTWQTEDQCVTGKCLFFDGSTSYVTAGNGTSVQLVTDLTLSAWIKLTSNNAVHDIVAKKGASGQFGYRLYTDASGKLNMEVSIDGSATTIVTGSTALSANTWYHVEGVYANSTSLTIYVNAIQDGQNTTSIPASIKNSSANVEIGSENSAGSNLMKGFIDDVKIFPYARTAAQVKAEYTAGTAGAGVPKGAASATANDQNNLGALANGLTGYWKMDETSGNPADSSGNSYTLTNVNSTTFGAGKFGNAGTFNGTTQYLYTATTISSVQTVAFWVYPSSTTDNFINLNGTTYITSSSGTVSATGTTSPSIYVNGVLNGTTTASAWNHVVVTTGTAISASSFEVGRANGSYLSNTSKMDEVRLYTRALSPGEVSQLYNWAPGPVGYWNFDEGSGTSVNDTSGNANTGTWIGTGSSHWVIGKFGKGGNFNGTDDYVDVGDPASGVLDFGSSSFTYSFWFKGSGLNQLVFNKRASSSTGYEALVGSGGVAGQVICRIGSGASVVSGSAWTGTNDGAWHFLTCVVDRNSSNLLTFGDGILKDSTSLSGLGTVSTSNPLEFGARNAASFYAGSLDDIRIYNYLRTPKQIIQDMNAGHPPPGSPVGSPVGYWKFDEGYGTGAAGGHNSGNCTSTCDGTLTGFSSPATATSGWTNSGKFGKALLFDGTADYVLMPSDVSQMKITGDLTLSAWINLTNTSSQHDIICKYTGTASTSAYCLYVDTSGKLNMSVVNATGPAIVTTTGSTTLSTSTWYHVAGVFGSASSVRLYVNAIQDAQNTTSIPTTLQNPSTVLELGSENGGTNDFNGTIDEPKVFSGALTADQIKLDMNRASTEVLGALSDNSSYQPLAANQEYCVPGDSTSCTAPFAEWKFDEGTGTTTNDTSGNALTGTLNGTTQWSSGCKVGKCLSFSGTPNYVWVANSTLFQVGTAVTYEGWFYATVQQQMTMFNKWASGTEDKSVGYGATAKRVYFYIHNVMAGVSLEANTDVELNTWTHFAAVYDGSKAYIYLNGKLDASKVASGDAGDFTNPLYIGHPDPGRGLNALAWVGKLDNFRFYNYARTPAQIAWDYNNGKPVGLWKMDECTGSTANDATGNANNGTLKIGAGGTQTSAGDCSTNASTAWYNGRNGKYNSSLNFDGTDDYVQLASNYGGSTWTEATVTAWAYLTTSTGGFQAVVEPNNTTFAHMQYYPTSAGNNVFYTNDGANPTLPVFLDATTGTWQFLAITAKSGDSRAYLNGVQYGSTVTTTYDYITQNSTPIKIGAGNAGGRFFNGQIDDVRIYNYALTPTQIKMVMNQGSAVRYGPITGSP